MDSPSQSGRVIHYGGRMTADETDTSLAAEPVVARRLSDYLANVPRRGGTAEVVADALREAIMDGVIPASSWLREEEISAELQVSRTPIREAIRRLTTEGLAVHVPNQGTQVAPMALEDILAVYAVREALEGLATRLAAQRATEDVHVQLAVLQAAYAEAVAEGDVSTAAQVNLGFHRAIRDASNNPYLQRFLTLIEHSVRRFGRSTLESPGRLANSVQEHQLIIDAIVEQRPDDAELHARAHLRNAREARLQVFLRDNF